MSRPIPARNAITAFFHCGGCLADCPPNMSPSEWSRLEAGFTKLGVQVRCRRCDLNIVHIDFEGQKHPANTDGTETY
jgi:hypothetical protein